jgi:hypothetical protein
MRTMSSGGRSSAAVTRKRTDAWYIMFRGDLTGNVCASVAANASTTRVGQPCVTDGTLR